jgi:predicted nucleotidyltransferase
MKSEATWMLVKNIEIPTDKITDFCQRWKITEFALFGSVLRDDFRSDSDVDILVTFDPDAHRTLFDLVDMQDELEAMFGRKVDLVSRRGIERSRNYLRRKAILNSAQIIYAVS